MTQLEAARSGQITDQLRQVAEAEGLQIEQVLGVVATGRAVIPANSTYALPSPRGVGKGLTTKVNANIGTSMHYPDVETEVEKLKAAVEAGADAVMDLSTGGNLREIRARIREACPVPLGTVPIYEAAARAKREGQGLINMTADELFDVIETNGKQGVDFITVHCGVTQNSVDQLRRQGRLMDIVSRGGAFLTAWMVANEAENPLYEQYDRLLEISRKYDMTLSLGDGLRPGCLADATDRGQISELVVLGELVKRAREAGVQAMVEGPGHVPLSQVPTNILLQKSLCEEAPFYVLGPLVTDVAPGYDHIVGAIGGALAAQYGADFLCYVTPAEHLGLPTAEHVREGVIVSRIAAHAGDIAKGLPGARDWDDEMARARKALDWPKQLSLALDEPKARAIYEARSSCEEEDVCSMCGEFCAVKLISEVLQK